MPSEYRQVEVAPGQRRLLKLASNVPPRNGRVLLVHRARGVVEVDQARWDAAEVQHG